MREIVHFLRLTLKERWKETDHEHQEDGDNAARDPALGWREEVAVIHPVQR